jgi:hypothetical protein
MVRLMPFQTLKPTHSHESDDGYDVELKEWNVEGRRGAAAPPAKPVARLNGFVRAWYRPNRGFGQEKVARWHVRQGKGQTA